MPAGADPALHAALADAARWGRREEDLDMVMIRQGADEQGGVNAIPTEETGGCYGPAARQRRGGCCNGGARLKDSHVRIGEIVRQIRV